MLPYLRSQYAGDSAYVWVDGTGTSHLVRQGEGGEQGDPLMPALFSVGLHTALQHIHSHLHPGEMVFAYLDDVYVLCEPNRVRDVFCLVRTSLAELVGIQVHFGKTRCWNAAGAEPPEVQALGEHARVGGDDAPSDSRGIKVLGTPVGHDTFVTAFGRDRTAKEHEFLDKLTRLPDLQSAWLLLLYCAVPRRRTNLAKNSNAT